MTDGMRMYQAGNLGNHAIVQQGEHLSLVINNLPPAPSAFSYRGIVGVLPLTDQSRIQQRMQLVEAIYTKLTQPGINALALTGMGGMGKSTLAALLYQYVQAQQATGNGFFQAPPLWLSIDHAATFADVIGTIFQQLDRPLSVLDNLSPAAQVGALFTLLDTLAPPRLIVLDQFDNLLDFDWATGIASPTQPGVGEWIDALGSHSWKSNSRVLLTSRLFPKGTQVVPPISFQEYAVGGLTPEEGLALLRSYGIQASEADLQTAVTFCDGHPLSLVLLMALIQLYGISLADLLAEPTLWIGDIATNLLDAVFQRLTEEQRTVLRALSVYRMAVPVAALTPFLTRSTSQQILPSLRSLLIQQVIHPAGNGRYQVHGVVARYAQAHFVEGDWHANQQALRVAHARAAHYYLEQARTRIPPREQRGVNDIQVIIEALWQYTQAAQWQEAYAVATREHLFDDLFVWHGYFLLLDLCQWFLPQTEWQPEPEQAINIYQYLGKVYETLGNHHRALEYYNQALSILREVGDRQDEGVTLFNIGDIHFAQKNYSQAMEYYNQALSIFREVGDRQHEGGILISLGNIINTFGNLKQAVEEFYPQALSIFREVGDRQHEGDALIRIGDVYENEAMNNYHRALEYYNQALSIFREVGDYGYERSTLIRIGRVYTKQDNHQQALEYYNQALSITRKAGNRYNEGSTLTLIGDAYEAVNNHQQALEYYNQALNLYREISDRYDEGNTLGIIGQVHSIQGNPQQALEYYNQALSISREMSDRYFEGHMLFRMGEAYGIQSNLQQALEYYNQALNLYREMSDRWKEGFILFEIGKAYYYLHNPQQALKYYNQALSIFREVGDHRGERELQIGIGIAALMQQRYDLALATLLVAQNYYKSIANPKKQLHARLLLLGLRGTIGEEQFAALLEYVRPRIQQIIEQGPAWQQAQD